MDVQIGLLCSVGRKQYLSLKCKNNPKNAKLISYYKIYKNTFTKFLRLAKVKFYENKYEKVSFSPKSTWKLVNNITSHNSINKAILVNNNLLNMDDNPKEASNEFNNYFIDVGKNFAKKFTKNHDRSIK